jgi:eukaryotic-like serine/threonine-protein kinase
LVCEAQAWQLDVVVDTLHHAKELLAIAQRASAPWVQGMLIELSAAMLQGRIDDFGTCLRELLVTDPTPNAAHSMELTLATAAIALDNLGEIRQGDTVTRRMGVIASLFAEPAPEVSYYPLGIRGMRTALADEDPASGLSSSEESRKIAVSIGHQRYRNLSDQLASMNRWFLGASSEAERTFVGFDIPDEEFGYGSSLRPFILAWLYAERGALADARTWANRLVDAGRARRLPLDEGRGHWVLAEVLRRAGEFDFAEAEIAAALALLGTVCPLDVPGALATRAGLFLDRGKPVEALAAAEDGLARYAAMGACSQFFRGAFLRLVHAECLRALDRRDEARTAIRTAREKILVNAEKIHDPIYRKSFLEGVPDNARTLALARQWAEEGDR